MSVIKRPIITERLTEEAETLNRYGFIVNPKASKIEIKKEIESMYDVTVRSVNTMNYLGKPKTRYTKAAILKGRTSDFKKAIVTLAEGDVIDFYSGI